MSTTYAIRLTVTTTLHLTDDQARGVAGRWATNSGFQLGLTSTSRDEPWLHISGLITASDTARPDLVAQTAADNLVAELRELGAAVATWEAVEVLSPAEVERWLNRPAIPPVVNAAELADLAGVTVQRVYQLESERAAAKRTDFPAPILDGYWLRSMGEHWARTRRRRPGPAPKPRANEDQADPRGLAHAGHDHPVHVDPDMPSAVTSARYDPDEQAG